jgi:hypothetical protein
LMATEELLKFVRSTFCVEPTDFWIFQALKA